MNCVDSGIKSQYVFVIMSAKNQHISENVPMESLGESPMPRLILSPRESKGPKTLTVPVDPKLL